MSRPLIERRRAGRPWANRQRPFKVVFFTTSYPRHADDFAGRFVSEPVERLRARGFEVEVVHPGVYDDFGLTFNGGGIISNLKRRPWVAPLLALSMIRALRRAAKDADLVHAQWLAGGVIALFSGKPFVVSLLGSISGGVLDDFLLLRRAPWLVRPILHRAKATICISEALVESAERARVRNIRFIPIGIDLPEPAGLEADPAEVFYTGRLSPEKGIQDLAACREGLNLVVSGDGPLRHLVPDALGFISRDELEQRYARAAVVVVPSRSEGFGVVCAEAMARGKAVVAAAAGGLLGLVRHEQTGLLVQPGNPAELRAAIDRLLADPALRRRLGRAARAWISELCSWERVLDSTVQTYADATDRPDLVTAPTPEPVPAAA
ncbi:MAG TPA: glycosyltransferase family 4 protein [Gaiellaceae bacterium]|nr:glycosyltransferase family 4 protein [Gaiellaceae bacterium]